MNNDPLQKSFESDQDSEILVLKQLKMYLRRCLDGDKWRMLQISANQTLNGNTEIHVPFNLVAGWCLEAEALPPSHRSAVLLFIYILLFCFYCSYSMTQPYHIHLSSLI